MIKCVSFITAFCLVLACTVGIVASAAEGFYKVNISNYLTSREFVGDDVLLTYDMPVAPYTQMYGYKRGENSPIDLGTSANVVFVNGKITVPYGNVLLHSWDFTESYVDSVSGVEAVPYSRWGATSSVVRDGNGLSFPSNYTCLYLYTVAGKDGTTLGSDSLLNRTVEIDIANCSISDVTKNCNLFGLTTVMSRVGAKYYDKGSYFGWYLNNDVTGWGLKSQFFGKSDFLPSAYSSVYFSDKTIRLVFDRMGYVYLFVAPMGTDDFVFVNLFNLRAFNEATGYTAGVYTLGDLSSENNNNFNGTIKGLRIYDNTGEIDLYEYERLTFDMAILGRYGSDLKVVNISDLRSGSQFTLTFDLTSTIDVVQGKIGVPSTRYNVVFLDEKFEAGSTVSNIISFDDLDLENGQTFKYSCDVLVPTGAKYFYLELITDNLVVIDTEQFTWVVDKVGMSFMISAVEDNSKTQQQIADKLDQIGQQLTPTPEQSDKSDRLEDEIGNAADDLENNNDTLSSLTPTRPQINTDLQLDQPSLLAVSPLVSNIWSINGVTKMIGVVLIIATVAYIFFGKRDA